MSPVYVSPDYGRVCDKFMCMKAGVWARWAGHYCYTHAICAGWLPGPVRREGDQMGFGV